MMPEPASPNLRLMESTTIQQAPRLSRRGLIWLLGLMCLVPIVTIILLWRTLPPVFPGQLKAEIQFNNVPPTRERAAIPAAAIIVKNMGEQDWTNINIRINTHYQIYEHGNPIAPGQERGYLLDRFVSRTGARYDISRVPLSHVEIYARLPNSARATFEQDIGH